MRFSTVSNLREQEAAVAAAIQAACPEQRWPLSVNRVLVTFVGDTTQSYEPLVTRFSSKFEVATRHRDGESRDSYISTGDFSAVEVAEILRVCGLLKRWEADEIDWPKPADYPRP